MRTDLVGATTDVDLEAVERVLERRLGRPIGDRGVERAVNQAAIELSPARVRSFLAILIERRARSILGGTSTPDHRASAPSDT